MSKSFSNNMDLEELKKELAFVTGWREATAVPSPGLKQIKEALSGCRSESDARYLGREHGKSAEIDQESESSNV